MNTLTFKITLNSGKSSTQRINIIGTNLTIDYGDGTTTTQEPNADGIGESHSWSCPNGTPSLTWTVTITGNITGLGDNCLMLGSNVYDVALPEGLLSIGNYCLNYVSGEKLIIPSTVTSIGYRFLLNSSVKNVIFLTKNLTTIGIEVLSNNTSLNSVKLPEGLKTLSMYSFESCTGLKTLEAPSTLTSFPNLTYSFTNVQLDTLKMNGGPISSPPINENTKIIVPLNKLQDFINHSSYPNERERYDVFGKNLSEKVYVLGVHLAENLQDKNIVASADDGLTTLANKIDDIYENIPRVIIEDDTVTDFADLRFTFIVPKNCTNIVNYCFYGSNNLKYCILPEGITRIGDFAFSQCNNLQQLEIPSTVTTLGESSIHSLRSLMTLRFKSAIPPTVPNQYNFRGIPTDCTIEVPQESLSAYLSVQYYPDPNTYTYVGY